jgi:4-amino-4-deoxy-L-arabinose transferase-like glycosyltransferase
MRFFSLPGRWITLLIAFQAVVLVAVPYGFSWAPPLDVVEGLVWAPHWLIGTYKHPPLPAWLIEISVLITQNVILGPYLVGQICVGLTYWFVYLLGKRLMEPMRAAAGTLLMAGSYYFTVPTLEFNHNVVQLPLWSGTLLLYSGLRKNPTRWRYWIALGLIGGIGLYGKYSYAILLVALLLFALIEPGTRAEFKTRKPYIGFALVLLLFLPHLVWLFLHGFEPFFYALDRGEGAKTSTPLLFLAVQLADHLPMVLIGLYAMWGHWPRPQEQTVEPTDRLFLRFVTLVPAGLTMAFFLLSGSSAKDMWGMPMFTPLGLWLVMELRFDWTDRHLKRACGAAIALLTLIAIGFVIQAYLPYRGKPSRSSWPMGAIATEVNRLWHEQSERPLTIIGGAPFAAGLAAIGQADRPAVMIGTTLEHSPWITEADIHEKGIAYVFTHDAAVPELCPSSSSKTTLKLDDQALPELTVILCPP